MPFPYPKIGNGGDGSAVSLPQNNPDRSMRYVTIAILIVGTRHCRLLILTNNSDAAGFDITFSPIPESPTILILTSKF